MRNPHRRRLGWLVLGSAVLAGGCEDAERLARVARKTAGRVEALTADATGRLAAGWKALRAGVEEPDLETRVLLRLRWDRTLAGAAITVQVVNGVVELRGKVGNAAQRQRAVELAQATAGVESVSDLLELADSEPEGG